MISSLPPSTRPGRTATTNASFASPVRNPAGLLEGPASRLLLAKCGRDREVHRLPGGYHRLCLPPRDNWQRPHSCEAFMINVFLYRGLLPALALSYSRLFDDPHGHHDTPSQIETNASSYEGGIEQMLLAELQQSTTFSPGRKRDQRYARLLRIGEESRFKLSYSMRACGNDSHIPNSGKCGLHSSKLSP